MAGQAGQAAHCRIWLFSDQGPALRAGGGACPRSAAGRAPPVDVHDHATCQSRAMRSSEALPVVLLVVQADRRPSRSGDGPRCRRGYAQAVSSSPQSGPSERITYTSARSSKVMIGAA